jgi:hypothetical protein
MQAFRTTLFLFLLTIAATHQAASDVPAVFGPARYDVKERYGKENRYTATFSAAEKTFLVKLQNGDATSSKSDHVALSINGQTVVLDDRYPYAFIACFIKLQKENTL